MVILITGATGFIGQRLVTELRARGHKVIAAHRGGGDSADSLQIDFTREFASERWSTTLSGVDIVINAVGILRERGKQTFASLHTRSPQALFAACATAGVKKVVQISALGADVGRTGYFASKHAADESLAKSSITWTIVQPSLVFGAGGASATLFCLLASLPIVPLPGSGMQRVQPIHIDDVISSIREIVESSMMDDTRVALVGPEAVTLKEFLRRLRERMKLSPARFATIPGWSMRVMAGIAEHLPGSLLDRETLAMLDASNTASPADTERLLHRSPRPPEQLISDDERARMLRDAQLAWLLPALRFSIALVWIWTGVVSLGLYPPANSYELLARVGISGVLAPLMLYGAAVLDLLVGLATLLLRNRRWLWRLQLAVIFGYTLIISFKLPEFWMHPYGPVSKNLVMLAAIYVLYTLESDRWNISS